MASDSLDVRLANALASESSPHPSQGDPPMSNYLYRLAHFAFRRRRLVLAVWLVAAIAAIAIAMVSGGKTNDNFTIPGTEAQNAANVLTARLPAFSGGQSTIVFATHGSAKITDPAQKAAIEA